LSSERRICPGDTLPDCTHAFPHNEINICKKYCGVCGKNRKCQEISIEEEVMLRLGGKIDDKHVG